MSDNRQMAAMLLNEAAETVVSKRPGVHGSAENSFEMIAQMWSVYLTHKVRTMTGVDVAVPITAVDVAQMMSLLKKGRFVYGNPDNPDNFVDDLGYSALAGMIQLPDPDSPELGDLVMKVNPVDTPLTKKADRPQKRKPEPTQVALEIDPEKFAQELSPKPAAKVRGVEGIDEYDPRTFRASDDGDPVEEAASAAELLNKIYASGDGSDGSNQ